MGVFNRLGDLVKANVNDLLDKAEDPQKLLKQLIRELDEAADSGKAEAAHILAEALRAENEVERKARDVAEWVKRAEVALREGQEELARKALERKLGHEKELRDLEDQAEQMRQSADLVKEEVKLLTEKAEDARLRLASLQARAQAAQTVARGQAAREKLNHPGAGVARFERIERHVADLERATQARQEIEREAKRGKQDEAQLLELEKKAAVEAELSSLKARLG